MSNIVDRIIFVSKDGTSREMTAEAIMKDMLLHTNLEIMSRGLVVQFPGPMNPKAEAVLISNGIEVSDYVAEQLIEADITENTLVLTMEEKQQKQVWEMLPDIDPTCVHVLPFFVGDELEIVNPYGGNVQTYGLCFENLRKIIRKLIEILNSEESLWRIRGGEDE